MTERDIDGFEIETYRRVWYIETGVCDGGGMGHWVATTESIRMTSRDKCEALRDEWVESGKLKEMHWGNDWRLTNNGYSLFRIRSDLEKIE